jgi:Zn-dependent protease
MTESLPYSAEAKITLQYTYQLAQEKYQGVIEPAHLLLSICLYRDYQANFIMKKLGADLAEVSNRCRELIETYTSNPDAEEIQPSAQVQAIVEHANQLASQTALPFINTSQILLGLLQTAPVVGKVLHEQGVTSEKVNAFLETSAQGLPQESSSVEQKTIRLAKEESVPELPQKFGISPLFIAILGATIVSGAMTWLGIGNTILSAFIFVIGGWVVTLCLHEFGHALVAYWGGDRTVVGKGYLTLNPLKYMHPVFSILFPILFLVLGGIGLPGGAVYIRRDLIRSQHMRALMSAAGILINLAMLLVMCVPIWLGWVDLVNHMHFWAVYHFLLFILGTSILFNLLPIPPLDGFGIITPYLPDPVLQMIAPLARFGNLILFFLIFYNDAFRNWFWGTVMSSIFQLGIDQSLIWMGLDLFMFWR